MAEEPRQITLEEWDRRYACSAHDCPPYVGRLGRHLQDGDLRLSSLLFDNSAAALRLWNLLLTEEERLADARARGIKIVGTMKDLGTVPVIAYSFENLLAFYPDGAWWLPCLMENSTRMLERADEVGVDDSYCPVRAMLGAYLTGLHFPAPDLNICSVGATCDDFSAIAQRLEHLGFPITWWEIPMRRAPEPGEPSVELAPGLRAPIAQVRFVRAELERVKRVMEELAGRVLDDDALSRGIGAANVVRRTLRELRALSFRAPKCPLPALELLVSEMLAIHYCSDRTEAEQVLAGLLTEARRRVHANAGYLDQNAMRVYWVNPVADLRVMNLLEQCGGRLCGTDFMFCHALDVIPEDVEPMEALARMALADPMVGTAWQRAKRLCREAAENGAEAIVFSRIPGASHCAYEGTVIRDAARRMNLPTIEIEVPPVIDPVVETIRTRLESLVETARGRRQTLPLRDRRQ